MQGNWQMTISVTEGEEEEDDEEEEEEIDDASTETRENVYLDSSRSRYVFRATTKLFPCIFPQSVSQLHKIKYIRTHNTRFSRYIEIYSPCGSFV